MAATQDTQAVMEEVKEPVAAVQVAQDGKGQADGGEGNAEGQPPREDAADGRRKEGLCVSAPAFVQRPKPHMISIFNPIDFNTAQMHCDLATLLVDDVRDCAAAHFGVEKGSFDLLHNGQVLVSEPAAKALDLGLGNGAVCVLQVKGTGPGGMMQSAGMLPMSAPQLAPQQLLMQQRMAMYGMMQQGAVRNGTSPPLTPSGGRSPALNPASMNGMRMRTDSRMGQQMLSGIGYPQVDALSSLPSSSSTAQRSLPPSRGTSPAEGGVLPLPPIGDASFASGEFCTYALTSEGARSLVSALQAQQDGSEVVGQLIPVIRPRFASLATHQQASKVLAAVAAAASPPQLADLLSTAAVHLCELVDSNCGSDVVAAMITALPEHADAGPAAPFLVDAMLPVLGPMCTSVNGRKVLQAAAARLGPEEMAPLYDNICMALPDLATDQCGCITLQRLYDSATDPRFKMQLQMRLIELCPQLISDPYGNYVLQHAVKDVPVVSQMVARQMCGNVLELACDKFASNVMERCLQSGPDNVRQALVSEACHPDVLPILMNDAFGNYVVQSCVDYCPNTMVDMVRDTVTPLLARSPYGYRIETKLQRRLKRGRNKEMRSLQGVRSRGDGMCPPLGYQNFAGNMMQMGPGLAMPPVPDMGMAGVGMGLPGMMPSPFAPSLPALCPDTPAY